MLAADTPLQALQKIVKRFACARPTRGVLMKVDERSRWHRWCPSSERKLPVSYLGVGQRVPDDLQPTTPAVLARWVAGLDSMVPLEKVPQCA